MFFVIVKLTTVEPALINKRLCVCVCFLPVDKLCIFVFEFRLEVTVGQTVAFQLCHLLLQITDLRETTGLLTRPTRHCSYKRATSALYNLYHKNSLISGCSSGNDVCDNVQKAEAQLAFNLLLLLHWFI